MKELVDTIKIIRINPKSLLSLAIYIFFIWVTIPNINISFRVYEIRITIWVSLLLSIFGLIWWVINKYSLKKNKSNLTGIGFIINSNYINKRDLKNSDFFKLLIDECSDIFNIIIYDKNDLKRYKNKKLYLNDIMEKLNITILFVVKERRGKINGQECYEVEIESSSVHFPFFVDKSIYPVLASDMTKSINNFISISKSNSLSDSKEEISMLKLSSMYLTAIMYILSSYPEKAYPILENINVILSATSIPKKQFKYISEKIPYRFLEVNYRIIYEILYTKEYYNNIDILNELESRLENHLKMLDKYFKTQKINKNDYKFYYQNYLLQKAIVLYERNKSKEALDVINKCDFTYKPNSSAYFSKNFLLVMNGRYKEAAISYRKLLKRNDLDENEINYIIKFINCRLDLNRNNKKLIFCLAIINYYLADKKYAIEEFNKLKNNDDKYSEAIDYILNNN